MTLLFCDSFDHYDTANLYAKWVYDGNSSIHIDGTSGRRGGGALHFNSPVNHYISKGFANLQTVFVGAAYKFIAFDDDEAFIRFMDGSDFKVYVGVTLSGQLKAWRYNGNLLATSTNVLSLNNWYYIEIKAKIADAAGELIVKVNGETWINFSGDTKYTSNAYTNSVRLGGSANSDLDWYMDDLYLCSSAGSYNNTYLGDIRIDARLPDGVGNSTQFTPTGAVNNYQCVNENPP